MSITPTAANCKMYVDIVKQQSRVLKLRDTGLALSRISTEEEGAELLANAASETVRDDGDVWSLAQGFSDWMHRYQKKPDYLDWFIPQLRRMIRAEKSDYFIVGARPSAGKSAFALQAALYWAVVCNKRVGFFSHETSREKLMDRLVACASGVPMDAIKERTLDDKQMEAVCSISSRINSAPLFLFSAAGDAVGARGLFIPQMAFFALAHVAYVCWFLPRARHRLRAVSLAVTVPLLVFLFAAIVPEAPFPAERIGVAVYGLVIAAMLYSALQYDGACAAGFKCAALLFVFSDAVIAWNRFIGPVPARTWIVMTTYYLAQYLFFRFAFKTAARN